MAPALEACLDQQQDPTAQAARVEVTLAYVAFLGARGINTLLAAATTARLRAIDFRITGFSARLVRLLDLVGVREELAVMGSVA
jgi:anti-anti-sigma regulatory factor